MNPFTTFLRNYKAKVGEVVTHTRIGSSPESTVKIILQPKI